MYVDYQRLVSYTIFTLFFARREFAPKAIINNFNIQDYLETHYFNALAHLAGRIHDAGNLEDTTVIGWESMNDPWIGLVGSTDLSKIMPAQNGRTTCPSPFQCMLGGEGAPIRAMFYGPLQIWRGTKTVNPHGCKAWLSSEKFDEKYGWKRGPDWKLGDCIWAQHGVWDPVKRELLRPDYFHRDREGVEMNEKRWTSDHFMPHITRFTETIRNIHKNAIIFVQPPPLFQPPDLKLKNIPRYVYTPHWYDGLTLTEKRWS